MSKTKVLLTIGAILTCGYFGWENIDDNYLCSQCGARKQVVKKYIFGINYKVNDKEWTAPIKEYEIIGVPHMHIYSGYGFGKENWGMMGDYYRNKGNADRVTCMAYDLCRLKLMKGKYNGDIKKEYLMDVDKYKKMNDACLSDFIGKLINDNADLTSR